MPSVSLGIATGEEPEDAPEVARGRRSRNAGHKTCRRTVAKAPAISRDAHRLFISRRGSHRYDQLPGDAGTAAPPCVPRTIPMIADAIQPSSKVG